MIKKGLVILFTIVFYSAFCQQSKEYILTGIVEMKQDKTVVPGADVIVRNVKDSTLVSGTVTDENGVFRLAVLKKDEYLISIHSIGLKSYHITKEVNSDFDFGRIGLDNDEIQLKEIVLKAKLPTIQRKLDKIIVNVDRSIYSTGENVYNLMNIIPEVRADGLGNINFRGQQGVILYVDNRRIWFSGQQLMSYLRAIPSESIKSMEISSVPGAQYDAAGTVAIINVITKKEYRYGLTGNVNSYYEQHRYPGVGAGTLMNYKIGKFNFQLHYSYSLFNFFNDINQTQRYDTNTPFVLVQQDNYRETYNNHNTEFAVDYDVLENHKAGIRYRLNYVDWNMDYYSDTQAYSNPAVIDSIFLTKNQETEFLNNQSVNVFYEIKTDTLGSRIYANYETLRYKNPSKAFYKSDFLYPDMMPIREADSSFIDNPIKVNIQIAKVDYEKNFQKNWKALLGSKLSFIRTDNTNLFYTGNEPNIIIDTQRSNQFVYNEDIYAFYGSLSKEWDNWSINTGMRVEKTNYSGNSVTTNTVFTKDRLDFFPTFFIQRKSGENHTLNLSFGRRILRPAYEYLNPFIDYENPYSYSTGNPDLNPAFANNIEMSYLYKNKYYFNAGYKNTSNLVGEILVKGDDNITVVSTYRNLSDENYYFVSSSIPITVTDWYSINNYLNLYHKEIDITEGSSQGNYSMSTIFFYTSHNFSLKNDLYLELNGYYQSRNIYSIYELRPQGALNFTLKKAFLEQKLNVNLSIYDMLYTQKSTTYANFDNVDRVSSSKFTSRMLKLSISYNFSSGKKEPAIDEREAPGEDEKDRIE